MNSTAGIGFFNPVLSLYPNTKVCSTTLPIVVNIEKPLDNAFHCINFIGYIPEQASYCSYG